MQFKIQIKRFILRLMIMSSSHGGVLYKAVYARCTINSFANEIWNMHFLILSQN